MKCFMLARDNQNKAVICALAAESRNHKQMTTRSFPDVVIVKMNRNQSWCVLAVREKVVD